MLIQIDIKENGVMVEREFDTNDIIGITDGIGCRCSKIVLANGKKHNTKLYRKQLYLLLADKGFNAKVI